MRDPLCNINGNVGEAALGLQRLIPTIPPRMLTLLLRVFGTQAVVDRAFTWYLNQAHPSFAEHESEADQVRRMSSVVTSAGA